MSSKAKYLFFVTDKYPYGNSEAFIENEIEILNRYFDKIFVIPMGLTVDGRKVRSMPDKCVLVPAANRDFIYKNGAPSVGTRVLWTIKHMLLWTAMCFFSPELYCEIKNAGNEGKLSLAVVKDIVRALAPEIRNRIYLKKYFKDIKGLKGDAYIYSYWTRLSVCSMQKICDDILHIKPRKTVCRAHGADLYDDRKKSGYLPFRTKIVKTVDNVYTISDNGYSYLSSLYAEQKDKIKLSYLGTKDYGINNDTKDKKNIRIASCSYVVPVKRLNLIIDALSIIDVDNIEWIHLGGGNDLAAMKAYADRKLAGRIKYEFKGNMANGDIIEFYKKNYIDLFINFSESEGLPVSIMEAMSFGIPVIATDVGGTADAVIPGYTGYLIDKDFRINEAADKITDFITMPISEHQKFRINSRNFWEKHFFAESNYIDFAEELIDK